MHIHHIIVRSDTDKPKEQLADTAAMFAGMLRMNGQVCGSEWPVYFDGDRCIAVVMAPEENSLAGDKHGEYVRKVLLEAGLEGVSITSTAIAEDCTSAEACTCNAPTGYVLYTTYLSLESPIRCIDCFLPVPLYKFSVLDSGDYHKLICWQSDYQSCDRLQMNCTILERHATLQISSASSSLSIVGHEICRTFEEFAGKPFYYYLYRDKGRSAKAEIARLCPSCGDDWHLSTPLHRLFHFKCNRCKLVSNFAWNLNESGIS